MKGLKKLRAFTLIELLLVLVILAVLASVAVPILAKRLEMARRNATIAEISHMKSALGTFEVDNGRDPTTAEGLLALVQPTAGLENTWAGRYLDKVPLDKWGHPYIYTCPGTDDPESFDLVSLGADGVAGTDDDINKFTER